MNEQQIRDSRRRRVMQKVEEIVDHLEQGDQDAVKISAVAEEIIRKLREDLGLYGGRLYEADGDSYVLRATFQGAKPVLEEIRIERNYPPIELCLMRGAIYMASDDPRLDEQLEKELGVTQFAAIEIGNQRYIIGFDTSPGYDRDDVLFSLGAVRKSINRRIRQDRINEIFRQARQIQDSILPKSSPRHGNFDIAGKSISLESVGGDLFDYIPITDRILGLAIADASGHGLPAALQVRDIYMGLRMGLARDFKIVRTVERLNGIIHESRMTSRFVSLFYGELELNGTFIYVNAGHPPPFHVSAEGVVTSLREGGPIVGPLPDPTYDRGFVNLRKGDVIVLYTDGITESLGGDDPDGEEYGSERLAEVVLARRSRGSQEIVDAIFADIEQWSGSREANDDRTVVVVTVG